MFFLVVSLSLIVVYGFCAYYSVLFRGEQFRGLDVPCYISMLEGMRSSDFSYALYYAFSSLKGRH